MDLLSLIQVFTWAYLFFILPKIILVQMESIWMRVSLEKREKEFLLLYWSHQGLEEETAKVHKAHSGTVSGSVGSYQPLTICKVIWQRGFYLTSFSLWNLNPKRQNSRPLPLFYLLICGIFINPLQWAMHCSQHSGCTVEQNQQSCQPSRCLYPPWSLRQPLFPLKHCTPTFTGWDTELHSHACTLACGAHGFTS